MKTSTAINESSEKITEKNPAENKNILLNFVSKADGLNIKQQTSDYVIIEQNEDRSFLKVFFNNISCITFSKKEQGECYIQLNFINNTKCILTNGLIGFAPIKSILLDKNSLPEIVSSIDLLNIIEAFEDSLRNSGESEDFLFLSQVYHSVLNGGKNIGIEWNFHIPHFHSLGLSSQVLN
ncbi:MAG: hypothetical protein HAW60_03740 [Bdellovibrionales bacterium]|nr:hypothetical protein [Bdellovibrionales bacterium]